MKPQKFSFYFLILIGCLQFLGIALGSKQLKGLGLATVASPLPLVFSHFRNHETFAADFHIFLTQQNKIIYEKQITPKLYSNLQGPYNRRNIYGAVFSYGPHLNQAGEKKLVQTALKNAFCNNGFLAKEFQLPQLFDLAKIHIRTKTKNKEQTFKLEVSCL